VAVVVGVAAAVAGAVMWPRPPRLAATGADNQRLRKAARVLAALHA
jgi:hypothetical protein